MIVIGGIFHENPFRVPPARFLHALRERRAKQAGSSPTVT
jgi:hypothetical protein